MLYFLFCDSNWSASKLKVTFCLSKMLGLSENPSTISKKHLCDTRAFDFLFLLKSNNYNEKGNASCSTVANNKIHILDIDRQPTLCISKHLSLPSHCT